MTKVRFIDNLKVGAYNTGDGASVSINDNVDNYILTATGGDTIQGESGAVIKGGKLGIGTTDPSARFEISIDDVDDLMLIKNSTTNQGVRITNDGILQLIEFAALPTAIEGGLVYNNDGLWVGVS